MNDVGDAIAGAMDQPRSEVDRYIQAFQIKEEKFEIYWPGGEVIQCVRPRRYGNLKDAFDLGKEWYQQLTREDVEIDHPKLAEALKELGPVPIDVKEATASFFLKHFCVEPRFNDVQAVQMIGCPELLESLYDQIQTELSTLERMRQLMEVKTEGEDSGQTTGTTSGQPSVKNSDSLTPTP